MTLPARPSRRRGHTLTELLVVLTILALFAFIAIPRFVTALGRARLDGVMSSLRSDLQFARSRAIATGRRMQVAMDPDTRELVVLPVRFEELEGTAGSQNGAEPEPALREQFPQWLTVTAWELAPLGFDSSAPGGAGAPLGTGSPDSPLTFYPEGRSDGARILVEDADKNVRGLIVDPLTGEIRELTPEELR